MKSGEGFYLNHTTDRTTEVVVHNECWNDFISWLLIVMEKRVAPPVDFHIVTPEDVL